MSRYIDADKLHYSRIRIIHPDGTIGGYNAVVMSAEINNAPTADVEEVKTAVFEECANNSGFKCSRCKARVKIRDVVNGTHKYCYKCGARFVGVIPHKEKKE